MIYVYFYVDKKVVMCYWASWAVYRSGNGNHTIDHIDPAYCTHIIYSFAGLNLAGSIDVLDFTSDVTKGERIRKTLMLLECRLQHVLCGAAEL